MESEQRAALMHFNTDQVCFLAELGMLKLILFLHVHVHSGIHNGGRTENWSHHTAALQQAVRLGLWYISLVQCHSFVTVQDHVQKWFGPLLPTSVMSAIHWPIDCTLYFTCAHVTCTAVHETYVSYLLSTFVVEIFLPALQDNMDELIRQSDCLVSHSKDCCSASGSAHYTEYMQSPSISIKGNGMRDPCKRLRLKCQDEAEAYSDFKVNVNFTPAPPYSEATNTFKTEQRKDKHRLEESTVVKEKTMFIWLS